MKNKNSMDKIDEYFDGQPNQNIFYLVVIVLVILFAGVIESYTYEDSANFLENKQEELEVIEADLIKLNTFLEEEKNNSQISRLKADLSKYNQEKKEISEENNYFAGKLKEASTLLYNQENWSKFMGKINKAALDFNVDLGDIKSKINDPKSQKVEEIFSANFSMTGRFQSMLNFINALESSIDIVDVHDLTISTEAIENKDEKDSKSKDKNDNKAAGKNINADMKVLVWGIKY